MQVTRLSEPGSDDINEMTEPVTAHVRAIDAINPADLGFRDAVSGGVLAANVNPGSGNPIGGQTVAIKTWGRTVDEMVLRQPSGLKSASARTRSGSTATKATKRCPRPASGRQPSSAR